MSQTAKFWDKHAESYAKRPVSDEESYQKKLQVTRGYLKPDMEVLEFGCGTGSTAIAHAPYVKHIEAIDVSSKMLEIAQGKVDANNVENVTFKQSGIDEFSAPDQSFDAVLALSVLHLLENKEEAISRVHKMLKPGGIFVTSTACLEDMAIYFTVLIKVLGPIGKFFRLLPVLKIFTAKELENSLIDAGFEIDHRWLPGKDKAIFIVAKKAG